MCRSKADGGQRCYGHAKARYESAVTRHVRARRAAEVAFGDGASEARLDVLRQRATNARRAREQATVELASTVRGRRELLTEVEALRGRPERWAIARRAELGNKIRLGVDLERTKATARRAALASDAAGSSTDDDLGARLADRAAYDERARETRAQAAGLGHLVRVDTPRQSSDGSRPKHTASCNRCGRLGASIDPRSAQMSANVHAGQIVERAAAVPA